jgi:catechol-2,3-dioxygenase
MEDIVTKLIEDFEQGKITRRRLVRSLALASAAMSASAAENGPIVKAAYVNHVSYRVADYSKTRDFYSEVFGMTISEDDGKQCRLAIGDSSLFPRTWPTNTPLVDHICYSVANWDTDKTIFRDSLQEFKRRGLVKRVGVDSFHIGDPDGFEVQIGGKNP